MINFSYFWTFYVFFPDEKDLRLESVLRNTVLLSLDKIIILFFLQLTVGTNLKKVPIFYLHQNSFTK